MSRTTASESGRATGANSWGILRELRRPLLLGLVLLCLIPMLAQWRQLLSAVGLLGAALLPLAALHTLPILLDSRGWLALMRLLQPPLAPSARYLWGAALIREAITSCLPLSGIGAFAAALRLLALRGIPTASAVAGVAAESTLTLVTQTVLMLVAIVPWMWTAPNHSGVPTAGVGLAVISAMTVAAVMLLQREGRIAGLLQGLLRRLGGLHRAHTWSSALGSVYQGLDRIYANPQVCMRAALWQLAGLAAAVGEMWLMLSLLHQPRPLLLALSLSAIAKLARGFAVALPAGLGAQELAFGGLLLGSGLGFEAGVAISIATRARDFLFGAPVLLGWLQLERSSRTLGTAEETSV